ncbi:hypothetical protein [Caulobacter segnis]
MIRFRALAVIAAAGLLGSACTATETRTPARIVMKGPADKVVAQAVPATQAMKAQLNIAPRDAQGMVEATITLPARGGADKAFVAMKDCIDAKLSCAFHGETVARVARLG